MDDIAGAGSRLAALNTLHSLKEMEDRKKFTFSTSKTKILHIEKEGQNKELSFMLKEGQIKECKDYQYLGTWLNNKGDFSRQMQEVEERAAKIGGVINCHGHKAISMELTTKLFLYTETGTKSIFGDVELWPALTKQNWEKLESIHTSTIKKFMGLPVTTPSWGVLAETGIWPIKATINYRRLMIFHKLINGKDRLAKRILESQMKREHQEDSWYNRTIEIADKLKLSLEVKGMKKSEWKKKIKSATTKAIQDEAEKEIKTKKKLRFVRSFEEKEYIRGHSFEDINLLLRVRLNMIKAKGNYGDKGVCRFCREEEETTEHLGVCDKINKEKVNAIEIKSGEYENSKKVLTRFREVEKMLQTEEMNNSTN